MKNLTQVLIVLFCLCMPALLHAQRDDSKYLAGAVPEVDGKVVFTKDFSIPGMSQDTIYSRLLRWMDARLAKNGNNSRVVFSDKEKGQILSINQANDPSRLYKEVWIGLNGVQSAVYATEVSPAEYLTYTTEESEKTEVFNLAEELGGDLELAIRRLANRLNG